MRVAIYTQHFVGVGHHVRSLRIAGAFARSLGEGLRALRPDLLVVEICRRSEAILRPFSTDFEAVLARADLLTSVAAPPAAKAS